MKNTKTAITQNSLAPYLEAYDRELIMEFLTFLFFVFSYRKIRCNCLWFDYVYVYVVVGNRKISLSVLVCNSVGFFFLLLFQFSLYHFLLYLVVGTCYALIVQLLLRARGRLTTLSNSKADHNLEGFFAGEAFRSNSTRLTSQHH